jgi:hypothetical protein
VGEVAEYLRERVHQTLEALRRAQEEGRTDAVAAHHSTLRHLRRLAEDNGIDLDSEP